MPAQYEQELEQYFQTNEEASSSCKWIRRISWSKDVYIISFFALRLAESTQDKQLQSAFLTCSKAPLMTPQSILQYFNFPQPSGSSTKSANGLSSSSCTASALEKKWHNLTIVHCFKQVNHDYSTWRHHAGIGFASSVHRERGTERLSSDCRRR